MAAALSLVLAACGGGGGSDSASTNAASASDTARSGSASASASSVAGVPATDTASTTTPAAADTGTSKSTASTAVVGNAANAPSTNTGATSGASTPAASAPDAASSVTSTPIPPQTARLFYGVNGHNNEGGAYDISSTALQLAQLQDLGAKFYRNEVYSPGTANKLAGIAQIMAAGGVTIYPVMLMGIDLVNNEDEAYNAGFALGQATANSRRYPYYEVTNELGSGALVGNVDGVYPQQYDMAKFRMMRGVIRGMIAGIRSVDTSGKIVMGGETWLHYGFNKMLAQGMEPDGSIGHPKVDWDITAWHWYSEMGDITNACGGTGCHNVLAELKKFGKPIWINEFGVRPNFGTDQQIADYLVGNRMMAQFVALASTYDIESIQSYELYDDPPTGEGPFGLLKNDGVTQKPAYSAYKNFVATHPM
ncbi:hypothetical protein AWB79_05160 [Caballeronia hypogeia]|uniref:Uncharacterized protein n=2 Tax=Caballeronia hypogeia TaxID=1777140 RepID=A0A158CEE9_9BURK|nr:hypothetical protein AWB79_05160 [Caballeronia hypogeia]